ncbi:hypothetical protein [Armatimonas sp.]|uniref:hypothetical protein n=1 Tax=Armatimonas sp. TaxID=1872638 RepID=UPI00286A0603|nr:hypothetical protein [Armatimonas sp.]
MSCKISPETLTALHESALPWWQVLTLKSHTQRCASCQAQLTHFIALDTQLLALAPISAEITQLFLQKHRRLIIGSSLAFAMLGVGTWCFFTPEITWEDVEKELRSAKTLSWTGTQNQLKPSFINSPIEWIVTVTDPNLPKNQPKKFTHYYRYEQAHPERVLLQDEPTFTQYGLTGSQVTQSKYVYLFTYNPQKNKSHIGVTLVRGQRLISFSSEMYTEIARGLGEKEIFSGTFTVLVDPRTRQIVERLSLTQRNGKASDSARDFDFRYEK